MSLSDIKTIVDNFSIKEEKFIDDIYYVNFINKFNKDNDIVLLENTSHYVTFEKPQWINETILSWRIKLKLHFRK